MSSTSGSTSTPHQNSNVDLDLNCIPDNDPECHSEAECSDFTIDEDYHDDPNTFDCKANVIHELKTAALLPHHESPNKLCRYCEGITYEAMHSDERYAHTPNVWTLPQSANDCELCSRVVEAIAADGRMFLEMSFSATELEEMQGEEFETFLLYAEIGKDEPRPVRARITSHSEIIFEVDKGTDQDEWLRWHQLASLKAFTDSSEHARRSESFLNLRVALTDEPNLPLLSVLVKEWMTQCRQGHRRCNSTSPGDIVPQLPTRVVDIREARTKGCVRVWHTQGARAHYIALSHCWGGKQPVKTEKGNLSQRVEGFPFTDLPLLFRDAVDTALALDIDYLWIDSLCIIQDDKEDWAAEAATMADVYTNSYLTIAASVAPNSSGRLLGPRATTPKAIRIPQSAKDDDEPAWSLFVDDRHKRSFVDDAHGSPLNKRAWVLQERLLSPRTLHFTGTQVYWECWRHAQCESLAFDQGGYRKTRIIPWSLSPSMALEKPHIIGDLGKWLDVVEMYTACQLTFASDKLVAIGGVVERMKAGDTNPFFKGVFIDSFREQLLWVVDDNKSSEFLPEAGAPTWSWASRSGAVHFALRWGGLTPDPTIRMIERQDSEGKLWDLRADLYTLDKNTLVGELKKGDYGYRRKEGSVFKGLLKGNRDAYFRFIREDASAAPEDNDTGHEKPKAPSMPHFTGYEDDSDFEDDDTVAGVMLDHEPGDEPNFESIFWVLVGHCCYNERNEYYCMLVQETEESKYVRVGMGLLFHNKWLHLYRSDVTID